MNKSLFILICLIWCSCRQNYDTPHVQIKTRMGDIEVEMFPDKAPATVSNFLSLVDKGFYNHTFFYRVLKTEQLPSDFNTGIVQGGMWLSPQSNRAVKGIPHESTAITGLSHINGIISMARRDTGTARTEFFICIGDQSSLDYGRSGTPDGQGYAAFGKVLKGMNILRKIQGQPSHGDQFDKPLEIFSIVRL